MGSKDPGYRTTIYSMAGVPSKIGTGLNAIQIDKTVPSAIPHTDIVPANPNRVYLLLQCTHATDGVQVNMGNEYMFNLDPGDSILWDRNHPWTGSIKAIGNTGDSSLRGVEVVLAAEGTI